MKTLTYIPEEHRLFKCLIIFFLSTLVTYSSFGQVDSLSSQMVSSVDSVNISETNGAAVAPKGPAKRKGRSIYDKGYDTIWVSNVNRNVKITVDKYAMPPRVDIGNNDFAAKVFGCCDVILKAKIVKGTAASLYIAYGDEGEKLYGGTIAYREFIPVDDEIINWRKKTDLPGPINETRAITTESPSLEMQQIARGLGIMEGKSKDRFTTIATMKEKMVFKLADIAQDVDFYYFKFILYNESKIDYKIEMVDFRYKNSKNEKEYRQGEPLLDNKVGVVPMRKSAALVYALPKFTITSKWELLVSVREKDGSRKLEITIPYDKINEAIKL